MMATVISNSTRLKPRALIQPALFGKTYDVGALPLPFPFSPELVSLYHTQTHFSYFRPGTPEADMEGKGHDWEAG